MNPDQQIKTAPTCHKADCTKNNKVIFFVYGKPTCGDCAIIMNDKKQKMILEALEDG